MATTFINTKAEAKVAEKIAHEYGCTSVTAESLYKKYANNVLIWNDTETRQALEEIKCAINARRKDIRESRLSREPKAIARAEQERREQVANDISARTGESYNEILKRV